MAGSGDASGGRSSIFCDIITMKVSMPSSSGMLV